MQVFLCYIFIKVQESCEPNLGNLGIEMTQTITNAMKETLARENDRKTASPTESAVQRKLTKGTLRSRLSEKVLYDSTLLG